MPTSTTIRESMAMTLTLSLTVLTGSPAGMGRMPTSSVGKTDRGVTLIELMVVVLLISLMVAISIPAVTSGIDSLRLNAATKSVVSFINSGLVRAGRRQQVVEITI